MRKTKQKMIFLTLIILIFVLEGCDLMFHDVKVEITNNTSAAVTEFYIREGSSDDWGTNILDANLSPDNSTIVTIAKGIYDFKAVYEDASVSELSDIDLKEVETYKLTLKKALQWKK